MKSNSSLHCALIPTCVIEVVNSATLAAKEACEYLEPSYS